jgi:hypothetical protein
MARWSGECRYDGWHRRSDPVGLAILFFLNIDDRLLLKKRQVDMPLPNLERRVDPTWPDSWKPWLVGTAALIVIDGPMLFQLIARGDDLARIYGLAIVVCKIVT